MTLNEEFEVKITKDGRIYLDFRGMKESSYKRIVDLLQETVGPVHPHEIPAGEDDPPKVREFQGRGLEEGEQDEDRLEQQGQA